ncbi:GAF domain-containing protein [Marinifilum flexuosum]|uniref:GAF domain-containing protein n=1 Tax=Marinifilum flexuosum TaxID=1117708 RepID=A0A419X355_9BACT|nr:GAF domain-containing protein [Marinifilum flexuosum]RKE02133.1 GAF domain-containing protein [Marinifilum flexuosum]
MKLDRLKLSIEEVPFKKSLSFVPLINKLKEQKKINGSLDIQGESILKLVEEKPELASADFDVNDVNRFKDEIHILMGYFFTPVQYREEIGVAATPFDDQNFYFTPKYLELYGNENLVVEMVEQKEQDKCFKTFSMLFYAYSMILKRYYNFELGIGYLFMYKVTDKLNELVKYYKLEVEKSCIDITYTGNLPELSEDQLHKMINNPLDMDFWLETLPIDKFKFSGFLSFRYVDVSQIEVISSLKSQLLEKSSIIKRNNFNQLEQNIRSLLELPNLKLGIIAFGMNEGNVENPSDFWHGFLSADRFSCEDYRGTIYEEVGIQGMPVLINDLSKRENPNQVEKALLDEGIRNIAVVPLYNEDELVGVMELGSNKAYDITFSNLRVIKDIIPVFSIAIQRTSEELQNKIEAIIKEECTAIHPSVEWRFARAASNLLLKKESGEPSQMEEIVFPHVYPLYGAIDVRHSSVIRNQTIQDDLLEQLDLVRNVVLSVNEVKEMPIYDQLIYKIDYFKDGIKKGLSSGDEMNVLNFIRHDIEPLFPHFEENGQMVKIAIQNYKNNIDPDLNIVYKRRKDFEDSLGIINDCVTTYLEKEEEKAQTMFPHYFEKYRTDGVEHNIYIGESIANNLNFDRIYLKNLRLWQLIVSAELARKAENLKKSLPIPMDTTGLILVHSQPLAIRFRQDEKKFDVDGAYNIRYEIVKKRIDKAKIKGTNERLTQPGMLAIIFSQEKEIAEYQRYLEYLISAGYFEDQIEYHTLEDLQGVYGLRAIRVKVKDGKEKDVLKLAEDLKIEN